MLGHTEHGSWQRKPGSSTVVLLCPDPFLHAMSQEMGKLLRTNGALAVRGRAVL